MSSGFLLLETLPGREGQVLDRLSRMPAVTQRSVVFPAAIAVKVESDGGIDPVARELGRIEGVVSTRVYRAKNT